MGLRGTEQLCLDFYERPSWVLELFELLTQRFLKYIEGPRSHCIDLVEISDHIGASMGSDCIETLTPPSHGGDVDLGEVKRRVGEKLCLIGGFDQALLERDSQDDVKEGVKRCIEEAANGGGYILYTTDHLNTAVIYRLRKVFLYPDTFIG